MVRLELQYLREIGPVTAPSDPVVDALQASIALQVCDPAFPSFAKAAVRETWTRDPSDRSP